MTANEAKSEMTKAERSPLSTVLRVRSPAFSAGGMIPATYTCDDRNASPPLSWDRGPDGTVAYALIMDDPDAPAGTWVHWVVWNISDTSLVEGMTPVPVGPTGIRQGKNSWHTRGYGGPCPPRGTHRYFFKVYALGSTLDLSPDTEKAGLIRAMGECILARGELMGRYERRRP